MIEILKTDNGTLRHLDAVESGCWVNVCVPNSQEVKWLADNLGIDNDFIDAMLDRDEISRIDKNEDASQALVVVDYPAAEDLDDKANPNLEQFDTQPISILLIENPSVVVTLTNAPCSIVDKLKSDRKLSIATGKHTRFLLDVLLEVSQSYIDALRVLEKQTMALERKMRKKQNNEGLMSMLGIEKSLLYMSTSLKSSAPTLQAIKNGQFVKLFDEDEELLNDVIVEYRQASEMCSIYTDVITRAMDAFSGVVSNNVNASMGVLTTITLLLSIPTVVFSFYGMNTNLLPMSDSWAFPMLLSVALAAVAVVILMRWRK